MFFFLSSKIVLVQALISAELLCGIFYLIQWLVADYIISKKTRVNMKELGDLILTSTLLLFIVSCHFSAIDPAVKVVSESTARAFNNVRCQTLHVCKALSAEVCGVGKPLHVAYLGGHKTSARIHCSHRI